MGTSESVALCLPPSERCVLFTSFCVCALCLCASGRFCVCFLAPSLLGRGDCVPVAFCVCARARACLWVRWTGVSPCQWLWFRISLSMSVGVHVCLSVRVGVGTVVSVA